MATNLKRTPSLMSPVLFNFEDHFHFEKLIGKSELSEVSLLILYVAPLHCSSLQPQEGSPRLQLQVCLQVWRVRHWQTQELFAVKRSKQQFASRMHRERCACFASPRKREGAYTQANVQKTCNALQQDRQRPKCITLSRSRQSPVCQKQLCTAAIMQLLNSEFCRAASFERYHDGLRQMLGLLA